MTVTKFIKTPKLFQYLDLEVKEALARHSIRDLYSYAWVGEDTPSDEFVGLAMWGSSGHSPIIYGCQPPSGYSIEDYALLITASEDLEALLDLARLAIGHALWMSDLIKSQSNFFNYDHHFWLNHINSVTLLGMASDRLRDLFLAVYFHTSFEVYKKANKKRAINPGGLESGYFQYPFADALNAPRLPSTDNILGELLNLAHSIYLKRESRNATVHDVATNAAKFMKNFLATDSPGLMTRTNISHEEMIANAGKVHEGNCAELDEAIKFVTDWYRNLVKATSMTFEIEHALTKSAAAKDTSLEE